MIPPITVATIPDDTDENQPFSEFFVECKFFEE